MNYPFTKERKKEGLLMFVYNFKLNSSFMFKILLAIIVFIVICLCIVIGIRLYKASTNDIGDGINYNGITELTPQNYATILQEVHDNMDSYIGQKIKFSGFVYRVYDLNQEQFVLGRNMIISSDFQTVVVGFLCHYKDAISFRDSIWVELEGKITKGSYHGSDMPILEVTNIQEVEKPNDEYVYPPDENYIPTSVIL